MTWRAAQAYIASTTDQYQFNAATLVRRGGWCTDFLATCGGHPSFTFD